MTRNGRLCIVLAFIHFIGFGATVAYIHLSNDPKASLIWMIWAVIDFPWTLLYFAAGPSYSSLLAEFSAKLEIVGYLFYMPHLVHGFVGTVWWYCLPKIAQKVRYIFRRK